jgi:uncharacterized protein (DUF1697 family)
VHSPTPLAKDRGAVIYIAFLRGMNVPGRSVKMERLRGLFGELCFANVRSYIQSGNVFVEASSDDREALARTIGLHLYRALGYEVAVCLRTIPELERIIALDPFKGLHVTSEMRLCVVFTTATIPGDLALPLRSPKGDMEIVRTTSHEAFVVWHLIGGHAPAAKGFQERVLGRDATTRYFQTTAKILAAAKRG